MPSRILEMIREKVKLLDEQPPKPQQQNNQQTKKTKQLTLERKEENNIKKNKCLFSKHLYNII